MEIVHSYCRAVIEEKLSTLHKEYHDNEYGFKVKTDNELFGRLILEINQAGLSWDTIIKKKASIKEAYANFNIVSISKFNEEDISLLLENAGIIRMRKKIEAIIFNAQQIIKLQEEFGSFSKWLNHHFPLSEKKWIKLFKKTFRFTGNEITKEFLRSTAYLEGAHDIHCPIYKKAKLANEQFTSSLS